MARKVDKTIKLCVICGDKAKGINFNVLTCMSCKAFFRRNALRKKDMKCPFNDTCQIDKITRKFCSKCRLKKCFESGMKKEWILSDEEKRLIKEKIIRNKLRKQQQELERQQNGENNINSNKRSGGASVRSNSNRRRNGSIKGSENPKNAATTNLQHQQQPTNHYDYIDNSIKYNSSFNNNDHNDHMIVNKQCSSDFTFTHPGSIKYSSSSSSSPSAVSSLFTEPSAYSLDILLTSDESDLFLDSASIYENTNCVPQRNILPSEQSSYVENSTYNNRQNHKLSSNISNMFNTISDNELGDCINNRDNNNNNDANSDELIISPFVVNEIDDIGLRFSSSSISSSLSDCCFLFSNSIDSIDFFEPNMENLELSNNGNNNEDDETSIINASNNNNPSMFTNINKTNLNFTNNLTTNNSLTGLTSTFESLLPSTSPTTTLQFNIKPEFHGTNTVIPISYQPTLLSDNGCNGVKSEDDDDNNNKIIINSNEDEGNNFNEDFSQYLLHGNDPPLAFQPKGTNLTKISNNNSFDPLCNNNDDDNNNSNINNSNNSHSHHYHRHFHTTNDIKSSQFDEIIGGKNNSSSLSIYNYHSANNGKQNDFLSNYITNEEMENDNICNYDPSIDFVPRINSNYHPILKQINFSNEELILPERYLIQELSTACSILQNPYKRIIIQSSFKNQHSHNCKITEFFLHRLIRMSKRLSSFSNLLLDDQIQLLKRGLIEMLCLRSVLLYDPDREAFSFVDDKCKLSIMVNMDVIKPCCVKYDYRRHKSFPNKFMHEWKTDNIIFDLLTAILLFTPRSDLRQNEKIKEENSRYTYLLRRYLDIKYNNTVEAKNSFAHLMSCIDEIRLLNEDITRLFISRNLSPVSPLFAQLLDLNPGVNSNPDNEFNDVHNYNNSANGNGDKMEPNGSNNINGSTDIQVKLKDNVNQKAMDTRDTTDFNNFQ